MQRQIFTPSSKLASAALFVYLAVFNFHKALAADRLIGLHSAQVMSQSMPWIAQEAGLFKKYDLDFRLVFISSSPVATAATINGDAEVQVTGAIGNVRAYVQGVTDLVFIGGIKNFLTHSVLGKPEIKRPEDLKGKKVGVGRFGSNTHYFVIQALKRLGMDASRDIQAIQTGGGPETLAALVGGSIDAGAIVAPGDAAAVARGFRYVINGPELRIPYGATQIVTMRPTIAKRGPVIGRFMRVMAEASRTLHTDRNLVYKVLGKHLRITDTKILDSAYQSEIPALERRLELSEAALQASLDEIAPLDARAKSITPQDMIDRRYLVELEKSGVFDK
ncbi:MAG: ABC transporter substrate-binding protein [Deltaproteobacteria bacterium]|nr:ABC transporter substrate-binding protein [Deltaproteobacteria bacterium]MBI2534401.1 ABC transporter substrate-binding protein [Deltaproteobacteria bacterium]